MVSCCSNQRKHGFLFPPLLKRKHACCFTLTLAIHPAHFLPLPSLPLLLLYVEYVSSAASQAREMFSSHLVFTGSVLFFSIEYEWSGGGILWSIR